MTENNKNAFIIGLIQLVVIVGFIAASVLISLALGNKKNTPPQTETQERTLIVRTQDVRPTTHQITFSTTGTTAARSEVQVTPQISGKVIAVSENFFTGADFKKGETLFEVEPEDFKLETRRLQSQVAQSQTTLNLEQAQADAALAEWKMFNPDRPAPALVAREPQLAEAKANLRAAQAQLKNARLDLNRTKVTMPFDGKVLSATLERGQFVQSGQSYGSVFDPAELEIQASLNAQELEWLQSGSGEIAITITHNNETQTYEGYLKRSAASLDAQTRFASITIGFKEPPESLIPGIFTTLNIAGPALNNTTEIRADALQNGGIVWAIQPDNTLTALTPMVIQTRENTALVSGITTPTKIVLGKLNGATKGTKVRLESELEPAL